MSWNFPDSPSSGQEFTPSGGPTYVFNAGVWKLKGGASAMMTISDTAPATPFVGQLWWESDTGNTYLWYDDGNTQQWVQQNVLPDAVVAAAQNPMGSVIDSIMASYTSNASITAVIPIDNTIPQISEGTQILSVTITPKTITNKLRCRFRGSAANSTVVSLVSAMFVGSGANAVASCWSLNSNIAGYPMPASIEYEYVPGTLTAQTISVRAGPSSAGTIAFNGQVATPFLGGTMAATLVVEEVVA